MKRPREESWGPNVLPTTLSAPSTAGDIGGNYRDEYCYQQQRGRRLQPHTCANSRMSKNINRSRLGNLPVPGAPDLARRACMPNITNLVADSDLNATVDPTRLSLEKPNTEYRPHYFASATFRQGRPTVLLFPSGRMVVTGATTTNEALLGAHLCRLQVEQIPQRMLFTDEDGFRYTSISTLERWTRYVNFRVVNAVGSGQICKGSLDLKAVVEQSPETTSWDPEIFPGAKRIVYANDEFSIPGYKPGTKICTVTIFDSGANVIMGAGSEEIVQKVQEYLEKAYSSLIDPTAPKDPSQRYMYRLARTLPTTVVDGADDPLQLEAERVPGPRLLPAGLDCNPTNAVGRSAALLAAARRHVTHLPTTADAMKKRWKQIVDNPHHQLWTELDTLFLEDD